MQVGDGQTLRHQPDVAEPFSLQIGDAQLIANGTGIQTIADFRSADIAAGGQGAPLAPYFHEWLFRQPGETRCVLNIGGVANVTVIADGADTIGFDTGPGNSLLDAWIRAHRDMRFDRNGEWAATGVVNDELLQQFLAEPYFAYAPPKSTGFEHFNLGWIEAHDADPEQDDAVLAADLGHARRAHEAAGLACDRLVFPCNHVGGLEQVGAAGIAKVRTPAMRNGSFAVPAPTLAGRAWAALTTPPAPVTETDHDGVCLHSGTEFLNWGPRAGLAKRVLHKRRISAALELAARGGGDVHFWLHPVDLVETRGLFSHFLTILDRLGQMRDKGQIEIATF